jgi:VanZ family protein
LLPYIERIDVSGVANRLTADDNRKPWYGMFHQALKFLAWLCVPAIVALSLVPGYLRPHTLSSGKAEHFLAYAGAGLLFGFAYSSLRERAIIWVGLAGISGVLEVLQSLIPNRSPNILDTLASASGLTTGLLLGALANACRPNVMRSERLERRLPSVDHRLGDGLE